MKINEHFNKQYHELVAKEYLKWLKEFIVAGDSFAAEWPTGKGWVHKLAEDNAVNIVAQAGVGEYKILKQLQECECHRSLLGKQL